MKGSELLGDIISLLFMIGISFVAGGVILWTINITENTGWGNMYSLTLDPVHQPVKYETMIMSYIETTEKSALIKNLIIRAVEQNTVDSVSYDGVSYNLASISAVTFNTWLEGKPYLLMLESEGDQHKLAGSSGSFIDVSNRRIAVKKITIPVKSATKDGALVMYVSG